MQTLWLAAAAAAALAFAPGDAAITRGGTEFARFRTSAPGTGFPAVLMAPDAFAPVNSTSKAASLVAAVKPPKIFRTRDEWQIEEEVDEANVPGHLKCGVTSKAHSGSSKDDRCPSACPFFAQNRLDDDFCTFVCVAEPDCRVMNAEAPIGDLEFGVCRSCVVDGCKTCDSSVAADKCMECLAGYHLDSDGMCNLRLGGRWHEVILSFLMVLAVVLVLLLVYVIVWVVDMSNRPLTNRVGLEHAMREREDKKLRQHQNEQGVRELWPLTTNMTKKDVAGPGMTLHFNFQVFLMIWALFVALTWMCFCKFGDADLWILGTRRFGTPRNNCILVAWGHETSMELNWAKISFLWIVYIGSTLMCFLYAIYQLRAFQDSDYQNKTMKDFAAMVVGLPPIPGERKVEEELKAKIESMSGQSVIGVSVAWDYQEYEEDVVKALEVDLDAADPPPDPISPPPMNGLRRHFYNLERNIFGMPSARPEVSSEFEEERDPIAELVLKMHNSPQAFVVFDTQEAMEVAIERAQGGFEFAGAEGIQLQAIVAEPATVQWVNFGHSSLKEKVIKLVAGFGIILLACLFWAVIFYSPYAYYVMTFNYENGRQPGAIVGFAFSMIVVVGNAIMYEVCARISDWVGFKFKDDREACYMILYTIACLFNVALDFWTTFHTVEKIMEGLGFRTYFGVPLQDVTEFTAKFETYGMQRALAENSYSYAFPSTFLIPFLIEPFPTIIGPMWVGRLLVKSHPELQGRFAEDYLAMVPMDLGRYADLLLNVILGILIFYFPGGYTWKLFLGMIVAHLWIYAFDHYKVLRCIPSCCFASFDIEWFAQAMLAPIMGVIAAALTFKSNCHKGGLLCVTGPPLILVCFCAWLASTLFHLALLIFVVPKFGKPPPAEDAACVQTFSHLASKVPCSWFTANPVHCLRSKHVYHHSPPCSNFVLGKADLMQVNKDIGCFYEEESAQKILMSPRQTWP